MNLNEAPSEFQEDISNLVSYLNSIGLEEVYLFGSLARNEATDDSDIDIAVRGIKAEDFFQVYGELMMRTTHSLDFIDLNLQESFGNQLSNSGELKRVFL
ncbi:MAG: nucleotidyltransferase domain-containing protein [Spirochaetaceae bacterium]